MKLRHLLIIASVAALPTAVSAQSAPKDPNAKAGAAAGANVGTPPGDGYFRVVFLAPPAELAGIYDLIAGFTGEFLSGAGR